MATIHRPEPAEARPLVPPMDPAEIQRRNRAAAALLDLWMAEGDEDEQTGALDVLREALGAGRVMSSRPALR